MNITLESLGLNKKELRAIVVERIVESVMDAHETETEFHRQIETAYTASIKAAVDKLAEQKVLPKVEEILASVTFQETNCWGESAKPKLTMKEYLVQTAEKWMTEEVNYAGKTKGEDSFSWRSNGTRVSHMIHEHLQYHIANAVEQSLKDLNSKIATGLETAVRIQIQQALDKLKINTSIQ